MKLLLINPKFPESFWSFSWALRNVTTDRKAVNSPLGLATLAALTPRDWEITILDENVEDIDWEFRADIVGVCGMGVQVPRQKEIIARFRKRGIYTVAGGSYASLCPEAYEGVADTILSGEAEYIWPLFCQDFSSGKAQALYKESGEVDLTNSPVPRYDLVKTHLYQKVSLQFSRGCPFRCEFCDIIVMFGRKPRTKSLDQVEIELDLLRHQGVTSVFFVDDNLIGHIHKAKELLKFLTEYQRRHRYRFSFGTESSINMAADDELLALFRAANFEWVFIGIETPNEEGLRETQKKQNLRGDLLTSIRTIYSYGIDIFAGFIVGFDADDRTIFERQYRFIVNSGIVVSMVGLLNALPKTPLYERLAKADRLRLGPSTDNTRPSTNVIPLKMSYDEMIEGYETLQQKLTDDQAIFERIRNKLRHMRHPITSPHYTLRQKIAYGARLLFRGILPGGPRRAAYFLRSCLPALRRPQVLAVVVTDWIAALALKNYRIRHFEAGKTWVEIKESLDPKRVRILARSLRRTLRKTQEGIVIDCLAFKDSGAQQVQFLLKKLKRYRQQISIRVHAHVNDESYLKLLREFSGFHFMIVPA